MGSPTFLRRNHGVFFHCPILAEGGASFFHQVSVDYSSRQFLKI